MPKSILLVDDSKTMIMNVRNSLEAAGFVVDSADDGTTALDKLRTGYKPDLIITDINMPVMSGLELIANVKALPGMRFVPILTLTTESDISMRAEAKKLGATGWLVKPIISTELIKVVRQVLPGA